MTQQVRAYRTMDEERKSWGYGPWQAEPIDKLQWIDERTGLDCLAVRNHFGAWCGYVGVPEEHPWFGKGYSQCLQDCPQSREGEYCGHERPDDLIAVHGGLTYADLCQGGPHAEVRGVCHLPFDGRPDKVWWFGFDTAHAFDLAPGTAQTCRMLGLAIESEIYRDLAYVKGQVEELAQQLLAVQEGRSRERATG